MRGGGSTMSHTWITRWENKVKKTLSCIKSLFYEITGDLNSTSHGSGSNPVHATIHTDIHIYIQTDIHTHIHTYIRLQCLLDCRSRHIFLCTSLENCRAFFLMHILIKNVS